MSTRALDDRLPAGWRWRDLGTLGFYVAAFGVCSWPVLDMVVDGWSNGGVVRVLVDGAAAAAGLPTATPYAAVVGLFCGLLAGVVLDSLRRRRGLVLVGGLLVGTDLVATPLGGQAFAGLLTPNGVAAWLVGGLVGAALAGVTPTALATGGRYEFDAAARRLLVGAGVLLAWAFVAAHLRYRPPFRVTDAGVGAQTPGYVGVASLTAVTYHGVAAAVFLYGLSTVWTGQQRTNVLVLGPQRSGKSAAFGGFHSAIERHVDSTVAVSATGVARLSDAVQMGEFPEPNEAGEARVLTLPYWTQGVLPEQLSLQTIDYSGELLDDILSPVSDTGGVSPFAADDSDRPESWEAATALVDGTETNPGVVSKAVWGCIEHADRIVLTVPVDDFTGPVVARDTEPPYYDVWGPTDTVSKESVAEAIRAETSQAIGPGELKRVTDRTDNYYIVEGALREAPRRYLSWYRDLIREFDDETDFVVVATMADWAVRDFQRRERGVDGGTPTPTVEYDRFCEYVYEELLTATLPMLENIRNGSSVDRVYLLWYRIENETPPRDGEALRIDTDTETTILKGALNVLDRLER